MAVLWLIVRRVNTHTSTTVLWSKFSELNSICWKYTFYRIGESRSWVELGSRPFWECWYTKITTCYLSTFCGAPKLSLLLHCRLSDYRLSHLAPSKATPFYLCRHRTFSDLQPWPEHFDTPLYHQTSSAPEKQNWRLLNARWSVQFISLFIVCCKAWGI